MLIRADICRYFSAKIVGVLLKWWHGIASNSQRKRSELARMAAGAVACACQARFAALPRLQVPLQPARVQNLSAFLTPLRKSSHARLQNHSSFLFGDHLLPLFPITDSPLRARIDGPPLQEGGTHILRRQLVLGGTGILIAAAAGNADRPAVAAAASGADSLVQPPASVLVIGAGGATGGRIVRELLKRGYKVKAGVRDVEKGKVRCTFM